MCDFSISSTKQAIPSAGFGGTGSEQIPAEPGTFYLRALDAKTGENKWECYMSGPARMWAGPVSTEGGLVFTGDDDGSLVALDARTGEDFSHFPMGNMIYSLPMTHMVEGKQYVTIATATDVFTFGLFEPGK